MFLNCACEYAALPGCLLARTSWRRDMGPEAASAAWVPDVLDQLIRAVPGNCT